MRNKSMELLTLSTNKQSINLTACSPTNPLQWRSSRLSMPKLTRALLIRWRKLVSKASLKRLTLSSILRQQSSQSRNRLQALSHNHSLSINLSLRNLWSSQMLPSWSHLNSLPQQCHHRWRNSQLDPRHHSNKLQCSQLLLRLLRPSVKPIRIHSVAVWKFLTMNLSQLPHPSPRALNLLPISNPVLQLSTLNPKVKTTYQTVSKECRIPRKLSSIGRRALIRTMEETSSWIIKARCLCLSRNRWTSHQVDRINSSHLDRVSHSPIKNSAILCLILCQWAQDQGWCSPWTTCHKRIACKHPTTYHRQVACLHLTRWVKEVSSHQANRTHFQWRCHRVRPLSSLPPLSSRTRNSSEANFKFQQMNESTSQNFKETKTKSQFSRSLILSARDPLLTPRCLASKTLVQGEFNWIRSETELLHPFCVIS